MCGNGFERSRLGEARPPERPSSAQSATLVVEADSRGDHRFPYLEDLAEAAEHIKARRLFSRLGPFADEGQDRGALLGLQRDNVVERARTPEIAEPLELTRLTSR